MEKIETLLLSRYSRMGASSRVRLYQYLPYLRSRGFHVTVAPLLDDEYLKNLYAGKRKPFDIIKGYLQRIRYLLTSSVSGGLLFNPRLLGLFWLLTGLTLKGKLIAQRER